MTSIDISPPGSWYIAYKRGDGKDIAVGIWFDTQELAQKHLDRMGKGVTPPQDFNDFMHVVQEQ